MQQYSSCAGPRPPQGIFQGMGLHTGRVEEPCFASPGPWMDESEGEHEDGNEDEEQS